MPDGGLDEDFPHVVHTVDSLAALGAIRPVIVVGIPNTQRRRDLTGPTRVATDSAIASHWLSLFNAAYAPKVAMPVYPGSLNLALRAPFNWFAEEIQRRTVRFDQAEYRGERDILLVPCVLSNLSAEPAWLWTPTTATRDRPDPWVVEVIAEKNLRETYGLIDGSLVEVELREERWRR